MVSFIARRQIWLPCSAMVLIVNSSCRTAKGSLGNFCGSSSASAITRCSRRRTFLLFGCALLLDGVTALLAAWTLIRVPFLMLGVAALLGSIAALLAGWTSVAGALLLLGVAALLGRVALPYRPGLPRRLVAWLTKRDDLPLTVDGDDGD